MMKNLIKKGDKIKIKENLMEEFIRCGFNKDDIESFVNEFKGKTTEALDVWQDTDKQIDGKVFRGSNEWFVTIDLCCEVPINSCQLL